MPELACPPEHDLLTLLDPEGGDTLAKAHLAECPSCRNRFQDLKATIGQFRALHQATAKSFSVTSVPAETWPPRIGKYYVVGPLAQGGQGKVYRALHPALETEVVIKLARTPLSALANDRPLLVAEGKTLASLSHPNLVRVLDLDVHEDLPFLVLEYVRGQTLKEYMVNHPQQPLQAAALLAKVARALEVAHRRGIIHQDLKPQNILVDETGEPKLIDFGLARFRDYWPTGYTDPSGGTPSYMSPEQARSDATIDARTDVFGLGAVLYFLLTRRPPYNGTTEREVLEQAREARFDKRALEARGIPDALRQITLKAMAAEPQQRFAHAGEFAAALEKAMEPTLHRRQWLIAASGLLGAASLYGIYKLATAPPTTVATVEPKLDLDVTVVRGEKYLPLKDALPLQRATDKIQVKFKAPPDWSVSLFLVDAEGKRELLTPSGSPADDHTRYVYPLSGRASLKDLPEGTTLLLALASPKDVPLPPMNGDRLALSPLAALPPKVAIGLDRDQPSRVGLTPMIGVEPDPVANVEESLNGLRLRLRDQVRLFQGIAFRL